MEPAVALRNWAAAFTAMNRGYLNLIRLPS